MKAYIIVRGGSVQDLQEKVEELVVEGYVPTGGVSILASSYVQAVFLKSVVQYFEKASAIPAVRRGPAVTD